MSDFYDNIITLCTKNGFSKEDAEKVLAAYQQDGIIKSLEEGRFIALVQSTSAKDTEVLEGLMKEYNCTENEAYFILNHDPFTAYQAVFQNYGRYIPELKKTYWAHAPQEEVNAEARRRGSSNEGQMPSTTRAQIAGDVSLWDVVRDVASLPFRGVKMGYDMTFNDLTPSQSLRQRSEDYANNANFTSVEGRKNLGASLYRSR